jgi:hypothetical protein
MAFKEMIAAAKLKPPQDRADAIEAEIEKLKAHLSISHQKVVWKRPPNFAKSLGDQLEASVKALNSLVEAGTLKIQANGDVDG